MDNYLLFFDLDGTLIQDGTKMRKEAYDLIKELQNRNNLCFVATGRGYSNVPKVLQETMDGFITLTGATCRLKDKKIFDQFISKREMNDFVRYCCEKRIPIFLENDYEMNLLSSNLESLSIIFRNMLPFTSKVYKSYTEYSIDDDFKISKVDVRKENIKEIKGYINKNDNLNLVDAGEGWHEILNKKVNKGITIRQLIEYLGADLNKTICLGDSDNDIEMFNTCSVGIAVFNALPSVKAVATYTLGEKTFDDLRNVLKRHGVI